MERAARLRTRVRAGPLRGLWLFAWVFLAQLGHLIEHIAKAIIGSGLLGPSFDSELSHLLFNGAIALLSLGLVGVHPRNFWVYPLSAISILHGLEHIYIFDQYMRTGVALGPGLLGNGGALNVIPLGRLELHNVYNGLEMNLIVLGMLVEVEGEFSAATDGV